MTANGLRLLTYWATAPTRDGVAEWVGTVRPAPPVSKGADLSASASCGTTDAPAHSHTHTEAEMP